MANPVMHTDMVLDTVRKKASRVILFYSCGKDSLVLLDLMAKKFDEVVCVFMYFVKGLEHIEKYLRYAEQKYPNVSVLQIPHYGLSTIYKYGIYCTPNANVTRKTSLADIDESIRIKTGCQWTFYGWKQSDGLNRRLTLRNYTLEAINEKTNKVYPLSHWGKHDVLTYVKHHKLPQPIAYGTKASNGVGFDIDCFLYLRKYYPNDLKKIFKEFPLSERILFEHDNKVPSGV